VGKVRTTRQRSIELAEAGRVPDAAIRLAVRMRTAARLRDLQRGTVDEHWERRRALIAERAERPITVAADEANAQHYEVPAEFFRLVLGPRLKYSSMIWPSEQASLTEAEDHTLRLTAERAGIANGQRILDLGCGWGPFTLWAAEHFPRSTVTALSNSHGQRALIERRARERGLDNVTVITGDAGTIDLPGRFDRIVSVEMMEHAMNHRALLAKVADALEPDGRLFVHVFTHATEAWEFDADDDNDWIGKYFFSGGTMPSDDLLLHEQRDLVLLDHWRHSGTHYERTLNAWLDHLDERRDDVAAALAGVGDDPVDVQVQRWRMFLMASAEVWGFRGGSEFLVSHYLFAPRRAIP
jgi:cyclopropane-fatty-acyl-phospholipid synthase